METLTKERTKSNTIKNHITVGVYIDGECKINIVAPEDLHGHVSYNLRSRFGRALFVDGKCIYDGCHLKEHQIKEWEAKIARMNIDASVSSPIYT